MASLDEFSTRSKRSHWSKYSSSDWRACGSSSRRRAAFSRPAVRAQLAFRGGFHQKLVGHRILQQVRQPAGDVVIRQVSVGPAFHMEQEIRRLQHGLDNHSRALQELAGGGRLRAKGGGVALKFVVAQRAAEGAAAEGANKLVAAFHIRGSGGFAGNQAVDVAGAESIQRKLLGRGAVGVDQQRRHALITRLVLETVDVILGREMRRGAAVIAEQIAHRVVVLAVRQAAGQMTLHGRARGLTQLGSDGGQRLVGVRRQILDPLRENLLFVRAGLDPLATGMRNALGGLLQEQRMRDVGPVHQRGQRQPEHLDLILARVRVGEVHPRAGSDAAGGVADAAMGGFENGIQLGREKSADRWRELCAQATAMRCQK